MTNSEAIKLIKGILPQKISYANLIGASSCYGDKYVYESPEPYALELAISALEENTKLKADVEQLSGELKEWNDMYTDHVGYYKAEIEQLKAEVEQFSNELISVLIENELLKKKNELTNYYFEQYSAAIDEIEKLKGLSDQQSELNIEQFKQIDNQYQEIEQLKSELEQSVRLPNELDKGTVCYIYANSVYTVSIDNIGKAIKLRGVRYFYGNYEEAKQSLKGQVEE